MSTLRLLRWLGPWTRQDKSPNGVSLRTIQCPTGPFQIYRGKQQKLGALFLLAGLHPEGPADPRVDRFARVMANAGYVVGAPSLQTMTDCEMHPRICEDAINAFKTFKEHVDGPIAIFSISASSIAALAIGAHEPSQKRLSKTLLFGGFINWREALVYAITGKMSNGRIGKIDPLNLPVIFLNLAHLLPTTPENPLLFKKQLKRFIDQCWEKEHYASKEQYGPIASQLAEVLSNKDRDLFLMATRIKNGGVDLAVQTAQLEHEEHQWLNPVPFLKKQKRPLVLVHGKDDVVVPWTQAQQIQRAAPTRLPTQRYITGFYDHTGVVKAWKLVLMLPLLPFELWRSIQVVWAMARLNRRP